MSHCSRRQFLARAAGGLSAAAALNRHPVLAQVPGQRPTRDPSVEVINPRGRAPVSFMIDDSTCLVNLNRFAIPQFGAAWRHTGYHQDWRSMPYEIPDDFVRKFSDWASGQGVKGKYSVIPYPACVGRLDLEVPGWPREQVDASIKLVRERMMPGWDIHPEMVTHTRVIDTKTGQPYPGHGLDFMENWQWTDGRSVDEIANYMAYALRILRNIDLPCEGITTPGDFGLQVLPELAQATLESCRDVFRVEIPHYFRDGISSGPGSVAPRVEYAGRLDTPDPRCVVSIVACSGDWTGGWDCTPPAEADPFITSDLQGGRVVEVIDRGEPAVMYGHWTGIYYNGQELGFKVMQEVVRRLHAKYDHLIWMKLNELSRYWAAKELTRIDRQGEKITLHAPFACQDFTLRLAARGASTPPRFVIDNKPHPLAEARSALALEAGQWLRTADRLTICFDLPKGESGLEIPAA